jgi:hypothetical protein
MQAEIESRGVQEFQERRPAGLPLITFVRRDHGQGNVSLLRRPPRLLVEPALRAGLLPAVRLALRVFCEEKDEVREPSGLDDGAARALFREVR